MVCVWLPRAEGDALKRRVQGLSSMTCGSNVELASFTRAPLSPLSTSFFFSHLHKFVALTERLAASIIMSTMEYPDLDCQTLFSLLCRCPFVGRLVLQRFSQCCGRHDEFVRRPQRALSVTCAHRLSSSLQLGLTYQTGGTMFALVQETDRRAPFGERYKNAAYVSVKGDRIESYGVHFESRDDVNFWLDINSRFRTFFVSALFSDEWEAWTQLAGSACAGIRYSACLTPKTHMSCGVQSSRKEVSAAVSVFHKARKSLSAFFGVMVSSTAVEPLFLCEKNFSWITVRYIQDLQSCACEFLFEPRGITLGFRLQQSACGVRRVFAFAW